MTGHRNLQFAIAVFQFAIVFAVADPAMPAAKAEPPAYQDVVFLGRTPPIVIRLHITIDGQPFGAVYQQAWDDYLKALFRHLDRDGDGFLNEAEGQRLPPPSQQVGGAAGRATNLAFNFRVVDTNGDGKIDLSEAAAYYRDYGSAGIQLNTAPAIPNIASPSNTLVSRLDTDKDGKLSVQELAAAVGLMEMDQDSDELLTQQELAGSVSTALNPGMRRPFPPGRQNVRPDGPFILHEPGQKSAALAQKLRDRFGEDAAAVLTRPPAVELRVRLGKLEPGQHLLEFLRGDNKVAQVRMTEVGLIVWLPDAKTGIELNVNDSRPAPVARTRQQYLDQFHAADVGKKGHVTLKDAQLRNFYPQQFALLDRDLDEKLTEQEVVDYLEQIQTRQARAVTSIVSILGSEGSRDLFDLLDYNRDGRLGSWELRAARRLPELFGAAELNVAEGLPRVYRLAVGLCQASFNRSGGHGVFTPRGLPMLAMDWSTPELAWFHKMDRNRDGYVSLREFLGPLTSFKKLDTDGDGLLSPEEALRAR